MLKESLRAKVLDGCLYDTKNYLHGCYKGFYLTIQPTATGQYLIKISATSPFNDNNAELHTFLQRQKAASKKITNIATEPNVLHMTVKSPSLAKNVPDALNSFIQPVIDYLVYNQYHTGCEYCGATEEVPKCYEINGEPHFLCNNCKENIHVALQENQAAQAAKKSNLAAGLVGAFLGSLIGCIIWILIYKLGYIAGIAGAVTGICAMKGYELLGGHLDKKGVFGSVVIMVAMIYFANRLAWSWEVYDAFKEYEISFSDAYKGLFPVLKESDLIGSFYTDLVIGYLLTAVASFRNIINAFKASTGSFTMKASK